MKSQSDYSSSEKLQSHKAIRVEFTGKNLTKFGCIQLVRKFLRQLNVKEELESAIPIEKRESKFLVGEMLVSLLYAVILDLEKQSDTLMLRLDRVFQKIAGVDDYPAQSTISRSLKNFRVETAKGITHVNHKILTEARKNIEGWTKITLDLDSHVRTAYGHREGAQVGYNPKKPKRRSFHPLYVVLSFGLTLVMSCWAGSAAAQSNSGSAVATVPGMPVVVDPTNLYSEASVGRLSPAVAGALQRVYVPNVRSNDVDVIDPARLKIVDRFKVGVNPQHVVPSWDLKTLWVANNAEGRTDGSLTPIDPKTGKPGPAIAVDDPYNMYFTPDGRSAIVVAETLKRLDFRNSHTMALQSSLATPQCAGINHADFSIDGRYVIFTCEFRGGLMKIDLVKRRVLGYLKLSKRGMPQDIRISPDGRVFYVADMRADGVFMVDGDTFSKIGFIPTGVGTHGLYPSRDGKKLYVANRGSNKIHGPPHGNGSVSVIDFATRKVEATWPIPGGGSPDMGNVSADGQQLWLSGRYDDVVYVIDTATGEVKSIPVGKEPHGLTVWPQPGRYSLGHTGNMR